MKKDNKKIVIILLAFISLLTNYLCIHVTDIRQS